MKRLFLAGAFALATFPALARDITVTMPEQDWAIAIQLWLRATQAQPPDWSVNEAASALRRRVEEAAKTPEPKPEVKKEEQK